MRPLILATTGLALPVYLHQVPIRTLRLGFLSSLTFWNSPCRVGGTGTVLPDASTQTGTWASVPPGLPHEQLQVTQWEVCSKSDLQMDFWDERSWLCRGTHSHFLPFLVLLSSAELCDVPPSSRSSSLALLGPVPGEVALFSWELETESLSSLSHRTLLPCGQQFADF